MAAPPVIASSATAATRVWLPLKDLLLTDGDGLAPPAFVARERDVLARDLGRPAFRVPHGESHVVVGGEVRPMGVPSVPFLARGTAADGQEYSGEQQELPADASHSRCPPHESKSHPMLRGTPPPVNRSGERV